MQAPWFTYLSFCVGSSGPLPLLTEFTILLWECWFARAPVQLWWGLGFTSMSTINSILVIMTEIEWWAGLAGAHIRGLMELHFSPHTCFQRCERSVSWEDVFLTTAYDRGKGFLPSFLEGCSSLFNLVFLARSWMIVTPKLPHLSLNTQRNQHIWGKKRFWSHGQSSNNSPTPFDILKHIKMKGLRASRLWPWKTTQHYVQQQRSECALQKHISLTLMDQTL